MDNIERLERIFAQTAKYGAEGCAGKEKKIMDIARLVVYGVLCVAVALCMTLIERPANTQTSEGNMKVNGDKPSVYITFEKRGPRQPLREDEKGSGVFLRLHNNLKTSIRFCAFGMMNGQQMAMYSDAAEIGINYEVDRVPTDNSFGNSTTTKAKRRTATELPIGYPVSSFCHSYELGGGKSLPFSVPTEHLLDGLLIRIPFNYQWEGTSENNPSHFISFSSSDLPRANKN